MMHVAPYIDRFSSKFLDFQEYHRNRIITVKGGEPYIQMITKTWSKNSFGLFNYHTHDLMIKNHFTIAGLDTKILRHEHTIE